MSIHSFETIQTLISLEQVAVSTPKYLSVAEHEILSSTQLIDLFDVQITPNQHRNNFQQLGEDQSNDQNSSQSSKQNQLAQAQRRSCKAIKKRRKRGQRSPLEVACKSSYWTKNFLQQGRNSHILYLKRMMGADYIERNGFLMEFKKKGTPSKQDYLRLYNIQELREVWEGFFKKRVMYRELMISRTEKLYKLIFEKFQFRYQEAFELGEFKNIAE